MITGMDIAREIGVGEDMVYAWLGGRQRPTLANFVRMARFLKMDAKDFCWLGMGLADLDVDLITLAVLPYVNRPRARSITVASMRRVLQEYGREPFDRALEAGGELPGPVVRDLECS